MAGRETDDAAEGTGDSNAWMVTFSDLLTLMITFFVLLLSMSSMDDKKLKSIMSSFTDSLGVMEMGKGGELKKIQIISDVKAISQDLLLEMNVIRQLLDEARREKGTDEEEKLKGKFDLEEMITIDDRGVVITFSDAVLFEAGTTEVSKSAYPMINVLVDRLKETDFDVSIEGHTDASPAGVGTSNWIISAKRARSVMEYLKSSSDIDLSRLSARGYGEYSPLVDNSSMENRAKNRRVEIILSKRWK